MAKENMTQVLRKVIPGYPITGDDDYAVIVLPDNEIGVEVVDGEYSISISKRVLISESKLKKLVKLLDRGK